jgi:YggT family protein
MQILAAAFWAVKVVVLARALYSWVDASPYPTNPLGRTLHQLTEPILAPVRRLLPELGPVDISPLVVFLAVELLQRALLGSW